MKSAFFKTAPLALFTAAILAGCSSSRYAREVPGADLRALARYELDTALGEERVSGSAESSTWLHFIPDSQNTADGYFSDVGSLFSGLSPTQSLALRAAVADACRRAGADFLLLPRYDMETSSAWFFYESAKCTVTGYPVKISGIRQIPAREAGGGQGGAGGK